MSVIIRSAALIQGASMPTTGFTSLWWSPGTVGGSVADATDVLARFRAFWAAIAGKLDPGLTIDFDPICVAVEATTGALTGAFAGTDPLSVTGTGSGDVLPHQTQGLVRLATSSVVNGRRLRGRLFIPGPIEASNDSAGNPSTSYTGDVTTAASGLLAAGATSSDLAVWHRPQGGTGGTAADVTGVSCSTRWSVLRSRRD